MCTHSSLAEFLLVATPSSVSLEEVKVVLVLPPIGLKHQSRGHLAYQSVSVVTNNHLRVPVVDLIGPHSQLA